MRFSTITTCFCFLTASLLYDNSPHAVALRGGVGPTDLATTLAHGEFLSSLAEEETSADEAKEEEAPPLWVIEQCEASRSNFTASILQNKQLHLCHDITQQPFLYYHLNPPYYGCAVGYAPMTKQHGCTRPFYSLNSLDVKTLYQKAATWIIDYMKDRSSKNDHLEDKTTLCQLTLTDYDPLGIEKDADSDPTDKGVSSGFSMLGMIDPSSRISLPKDHCPKAADYRHRGFTWFGIVCAGLADVTFIVYFLLLFTSSVYSSHKDKEQKKRTDDEVMIHRLLTYQLAFNQSASKDDFSRDIIEEIGPYLIGKNKAEEIFHPNNIRTFLKGLLSYDESNTHAFQISCFFSEVINATNFYIARAEMPFEIVNNENIQRHIWQRVFFSCLYAKIRHHLTTGDNTLIDELRKNGAIFSWLRDQTRPHHTAYFKNNQQITLCYLLKQLLIICIIGIGFTGGTIYLNYFAWKSTVNMPHNNTHPSDQQNYAFAILGTLFLNFFSLSLCIISLSIGFIEPLGSLTSRLFHFINPWINKFNGAYQTLISDCCSLEKNNGLFGHDIEAMKLIQSVYEKFNLTLPGQLTTKIESKHLRKSWEDLSGYFDKPEQEKEPPSCLDRMVSFFKRSEDGSIRDPLLDAVGKQAPDSSQNVELSYIT